MRQLAKAACAVTFSCPGVDDPEDGSGDLLVTGHDECGVEVQVRIARDLLVQALAR